MTVLHTRYVAENVPMAPKIDRLAQRIASIAARPVAAIAPPAKPGSKRQDERRPVYRQGRLTVAGGVKIDCIIVDVSENGARVELDGAESLPDFVMLKVVMTGEIRRARVAWKRDTAAGLAFLIERKTGFGAAGTTVS